MQDFAALLSAVSSFAWPLLVLGVVYLFRAELRRVIDSAQSRGIRLKVGGQELTIDEANQQQGDLIADLQRQVVTLRETVQGAGMNVPTAALAAAAPPITRRSALWVDDEPKNNSYLIQLLSDEGFDVDIALSTREGLKRFSGKRYDIVLSDMGRPERLLGYDRTAGLTLFKEIRKTDQAVPLILFTSARAVREYKAEVDRLGAYITNSATEVAEHLRRMFPTKPDRRPRKQG